jgi:hypothetical protein
VVVRTGEDGRFKTRAFVLGREYLLWTKGGCCCEPEWRKSWKIFELNFIPGWPDDFVKKSPKPFFVKNNCLKKTLVQMAKIRPIWSPCFIHKCVFCNFAVLS